MFPPGCSLLRVYLFHGEAKRLMPNLVNDTNISRDVTAFKRPPLASHCRPPFMGWGPLTLPSTVIPASDGGTAFRLFHGRDLVFKGGEAISNRIAIR